LSDERKPDFESAGVHEIDLEDLPTEVGILPLRDTLLFPQAVLPLAVSRGRPKRSAAAGVRSRSVMPRLARPASAVASSVA